jgi:hypothetical protein
VKDLGGTHGWRWPHEMKSMVVVWTCDDGQSPNLEKKKEKKQNGLKAKLISIGPFYFR